MSAPLNPAQAAAVLHSAGPLLVFAGAGSGKTRVITYRIARLIAEEGVPPGRILAVTFTNKAAGEMRERLESLAGAGLANDLWVGTFHSISAKLLRRYGPEVGLSSRFSIYDDSDQKALLARVIKNLDLDDRSYPSKVCLGKIHAKKRDGIRPHQVEVDPHFDETMLEIYTAYDKALRGADAVDFDDLITCMVELLERPMSAESGQPNASRELRERFDHILVDEFQDTNSVQYRWARALAARTRNLCVVGDDDQSIYSWRGADVRNIRDFARDFPDARVVKLEQNYRSSGNIVKAACCVIEAAEERQAKSLWTEAALGERIRIVAHRDERQEADWVAATLKARLGMGVPASELAVFYRVNAQSRVLEEALRRNRIAYQIVGGMRFFERAEVKNLLAYLRWLDNPNSDADLVRFFNVPTRGLGNKTLDRLLLLAHQEQLSVFEAMEHALSEDLIRGAAKKRLDSFVTLLRGLREAAADHAPSELAEEVLERSGYRDSLREQNDAEADARLENLQELVGSIKEYEQDVAHSDLQPTLSEYLERVSLIGDIDSIEPGSAVLLMTVHSAKGLEFDSVILTGMEEETFPYRGLEPDKQDELEEERRLAYVAITRARNRLYIGHASSRMLFGQTRYLAPSRFLADIPDDVSIQEGSAGGFVDRVRHMAAYARRAVDPYQRAPADDWDQRPEEERSWSSGESSREKEPVAVSAGGSVVDYSAFDDVPGEAGAGVATVTPAEHYAALRRGMRVFHRRFGPGIVERKEGADKVVARFKGYGERKVLAQFLTTQNS